MKYNRFLVLLTPVIVLISLESVFLSPKSFYFVLFFVNFLILTVIFLFFRDSHLGNFSYYLGEAILPFCFFTSIFVYSSLIVNKFLIQILFLATVIFIYFYLRNIYYFFINFAAGKSGLFKNLSSLANFSVMFFSGAAIYGLQAFLNLPVWLLMIFLVFISFLAVYQKFWINKIERETAWIYVLASLVILLEIGWAISFLPLSYNVLGLALAICYYVLMGLTVPSINNSLTGKTVKIYLIFGITSILLIFLTARWM
ncbi:MAG: hypothetical protein WC582_03930 [Patescibacteria group bacterium]